MLSRIIVRFKYLIITSVLILVGGAACLLPGLKLDVRFSTFFPTGDDHLAFYEDFVAKMGSTDPLCW